MNKKNLLERLTQIFRDIFDDDEIIITCDTSAKDIEDWDSFSQIRLVAAIEKDFGIKFKFGELSSLRNVGEMIDVIKQKISN